MFNEEVPGIRERDLRGGFDLLRNAGQASHNIELNELEIIWLGKASYRRNRMSKGPRAGRHRAHQIFGAENMETVSSFVRYILDLHFY